MPLNRGEGYFGGAVGQQRLEVLSLRLEAQTLVFHVRSHWSSVDASDRPGTAGKEPPGILGLRVGVTSSVFNPSHRQYQKVLPLLKTAFKNPRAAEETF